MNKQKKLLRSDIRYECGDAFYERGRSYFEKDAVLNLTVKSEGTLFVQLNAAVIGSYKTPYKQNIRIVWRPDYSAAEIEGDCTCPVGYNCKHVAAVCLMYQNSKLSLSAADAKPDCLDWLNSLHQQAPGHHDVSQDFIAYLLKPGNAKHEFTIDLLITKEKKTGGLNKGRKTTLNNLRYSYSYLNYVQPEDQEIAKLLTALNPSFKDEPLIAGATGYLALSKLLKTGRLFWQDVEQAPLIKGTGRDLKFDWQTTNNGDFQLAVKIDPPATLLLTDPPQYLDESLGLIGTVNAHNLSVDQLKNILDAPLIPTEYADEFSQRLIIEHPSDRKRIYAYIFLRPIDGQIAGKIQNAGLGGGIGILRCLLWSHSCWPYGECR